MPTTRHDDLALGRMAENLRQAPVPNECECAPCASARTVLAEAGWSPPPTLIWRRPAGSGSFHAWTTAELGRPSLCYGPGVGLAPSMTPSMLRQSDPARLAVAETCGLCRDRVPGWTPEPQPADRDWATEAQRWIRRLSEQLGRMARTVVPEQEPDSDPAAAWTWLRADGDTYVHAWRAEAVADLLRRGERYGEGDYNACGSLYWEADFARDTEHPRCAECVADVLADAGVTVPYPYDEPF